MKQIFIVRPPEKYFLYFELRLYLANVCLEKVNKVSYLHEFRYICPLKFLSIFQNILFTEIVWVRVYFAPYP